MKSGCGFAQESLDPGLIPETSALVPEPSDHIHSPFLNPEPSRLSHPVQDAPLAGRSTFSTLAQKIQCRVMASKPDRVTNYEIKSLTEAPFRSL